MFKILKRKAVFYKILGGSAILLFFAVFIMNACKDKCNCTNEPCPCIPFTISIYANVNNAAEGSFATKEIDYFYLVRTTENYELMDSMKMNFQDIFTSEDYNKIFRFSAESYSNINDIRPYNFIIKNTLLKTADTISSITYTEVLKNVLCNVCSNCDDEYLDCVVFEDVSFDLNCNTQNSAEIILRRRAN